MSRPLLRDHTHTRSRRKPRLFSSLQTWGKRDGRILSMAGRTELHLSGRSVQSLVSLLVRKNYSSCNPWAVSVILIILEQVQEQWSGPAQDSVVPIVLERSHGALIFMGLLEWSWLLVRVAGQPTAGSQVTYHTSPSTPPKARTVPTCQTQQVRLYSTCLIIFKFYCPFWDLKPPGFKDIGKNLVTKGRKSSSKVVLVLGGNSSPKKRISWDHPPNTVLRAAKL